MPKNPIEGGLHEGGTPRFSLEESDKVVPEKETAVRSIEAEIAAHENEIKILKAEITAKEDDIKLKRDNLNQAKKELADARNPQVIAENLKEYVRAAISYLRSPDSKIDPSSDPQQGRETASELLKKKAIGDLRMRYRDASGKYHVEMKVGDVFSGPVQELLGKDVVQKIVDDVMREEGFDLEK